MTVNNYLILCSDNWGQNTLTRIIIGLLVCLAIPTVINELVLRPVLDKIIPVEDAARMVRFVLAIAVSIATYALLFRYYENRKVTELAARYAAKENILGFFGGGILVTIVLLVLLISGNFAISETGDFAIIFLPLISFALFALLEEIVFRGILYRIIEESLGTIIALVISAALFGIVHMGNEHANFLGVLSASSGGLLLGALYTFTGRLWYPISFHIGWNFFQYFFGLPVSGISDMEFYMISSREGPEWLAGGGFGIENSLITIGLVMGLSVLLVVLISKKGKMVLPFWIRRKTETNGS